MNVYQVALRKDYPGHPYDHYHRGFRAPCGVRVSVKGPGANAPDASVRQTQAESQARERWRAYVDGVPSRYTFTATEKMHPAFRIGMDYMDLYRAKNVVMNCTDGVEMHCTVTATPCR